MIKESKAHFAFQANSDTNIQTMLQILGFNSLDDLFKDIPADLLVKKRPESFPKAHSEMEAFQHLFSIFRKNKSGFEYLSFIGSGIYDHYIPAVVEEIQNRAEFKTSYTPYAPEMSQGLLTALFEYQSMICELTGLPAANNSMYDWATAIGEAALMCARIKNTKTPAIFLVAQNISPERLDTVWTYTEPAGIEINIIPFDSKTGQIDVQKLRNLVREKTNIIGIYIESPNVFGIIEDNLKEIIDLAHSTDALAIIGIDPISLGVLEAPGLLGADICVGEGQPLGNAPNFGGPLLGIFTTKSEREFLRNLPGRVIGYTKTKDTQKDAYVMTLQTREQHIRREKATSNICSNEALFSVGAAVYLALLGPDGLQDLGYHLLGRIGYLIDKINPAYLAFKAQTHFKELLLVLPKGQYAAFKAHMLQNNILIGRNFGTVLTDRTVDAVVISVSEKHSINDLDQLINVINSFKIS